MIVVLLLLIVNTLPSFCDFGTCKKELGGINRYQRKRKMALATTFSASSPSHHHKIFDSNSFQPSIFTSTFLFRHHSPTLRLHSNFNSNTHPPRSLSSGPGPPSSPDSALLVPQVSTIFSSFFIFIYLGSFIYAFWL